MIVPKYLDIFQKSKKDIADLLEKIVGDGRRDERRDGVGLYSIIVTWQVSFDYIREIRASATRLLLLISLFDR